MLMLWRNSLDGRWNRTILESAQKELKDNDDQSLIYFFQICLEPSSRRASAQAFPAAYEGVKDLDSLMFQFSRQFSIPQEMLYILRNLIDLTIQKGADNTRLESENKVKEYLT
ncbi:unnamed protein product [Meloidogyne enterolobii]|uniref:Uncharacterized protein n=1 Tax=Meloidogyne enterolobii TaxID=390850 RepID=A0ACB1AEI6_MELEN